MAPDQPEDREHPDLPDQPGDPGPVDGDTDLDTDLDSDTHTGTGEVPAAPDVPHTGDAAVDEALARLADAASLPLEDQVSTFDAVHRTLQDRLADVDG